jgi:L-ascorbate metabolism protein UlaG (beta-lactamase superfamily)
VGKTVILIDPFLTRKEPSANTQWKNEHNGFGSYIR